jgi:uncharacterized phiE125 gp8 family phage protein
MQLIIETPPESEPISVDELALHLRIDEYDSDSDSELYDIITAAREIVEDITSRKLFTQTWNCYIDKFPSANSFKLPFGNLQSVEHLKYTDSDGVDTTLTENTDYIVELNGEQCGKIVLPYSVSWPSFTEYSSNPIEVQFTCGWSDVANIPGKYKSAIKLICGDLYKNREIQDYKVNNTAMNMLTSCHLYDEFI